MLRGALRRRQSIHIRQIIALGFVPQFAPKAGVKRKIMIPVGAEAHQNRERANAPSSVVLDVRPNAH